MMITHSTLTFLLCLSLCRFGASFTFQFPKDTPLPPYAYEGFRQVPYFPIGIYSSQSVAAAIGGFSNVNPTVDVSIDAMGGASEYLQVHVYNAELIESLPLLQGTTISPCMDAGQQRGIVRLPEMRANSFVLSVGKVVGSDVYSIRETLYLPTTGLYIVTFNVCRYVNVSLWPEGTRRELDLSGWKDVRISGKIQFRNPFGFLPGQSFGLQAVYATLFSVSAVALLWFLGWTWRVGRNNLIRYQWVLAALLVLSVLTYMLLLAYYTTLNRSDNDVYPLFVAGRVLVMLRNSCATLTIFLVCYGWALAVRRMSGFAAGAILAATSARMIINFSEFAFAQTIESVNFRSGAGAFSTFQQQPLLAWKAARIAGIMLDIGIGFACGLALKWTIEKLKADGQSQKVSLFNLSGIALGLSCASASAMGILVAIQSESDLATLGESRWRVVWVPEATFEFIYCATIIVLCGIWVPSRSMSQYLVYGQMPELPDTRPRTRNHRGKQHGNTNSPSTPKQQQSYHQDVEMASRYPSIDEPSVPRVRPQPVGKTGVSKRIRQGEEFSSESSGGIEGGDVA